MLAAEQIDAQAVNMMVRHGGGLTYVALPADRCNRLGITPMSGASSDVMVTIEARDNVTTGISAADRARTIAVVADPESNPKDLLSPGHIVPLRARPEGLLDNPDRAELGTELVRLAGLQPVAAMTEILGGRGDPLGASELIAYSDRHDIKVVRADSLVAYKWSLERRLRTVGKLKMRTAFGQFDAVCFQAPPKRVRHVALVRGDLGSPGPTSVTVHVECLASHVFGAPDCDCARRMRRALERLSAADRGVLIYISNPDRSFANVTIPTEPGGAAASHIARDDRSLASEIASAVGVRSPVFVEAV